MEYSQLAFDFESESMCEQSKARSQVALVPLDLPSAPVTVLVIGKYDRSLYDALRELRVLLDKNFELM